MLRKLLQDADDMFARLHKTSRIKMIERGGVKIASMLVRADPWKGGACGRERCLPCSNHQEKGKLGKCIQESVGSLYAGMQRM